MNKTFCVLLSSLALLSAVHSFAADAPVAQANANPAYQQLRHIHTVDAAYEVQNLTLVRDVGTFQLKSGTLCLLAPVEGMVTGAVFRGEGSFHLKSDDPREQNQLKALTKDAGMDEEFEKLVLRFADGTADELGKALTTKSSVGCPGDVLEENQKYLRTEFSYNLSGRLLQPVLAGKPDGFFAAFFRGKKYGRLSFWIDPAGLVEFDLQPEEVALIASNESKEGVWYAGHLLNEARNGWRVIRTNHRAGMVKNVNQKMDVTIEKNAHLSATVTGTFQSHVDGLRVVPLDLFEKLRVSKVTDSTGTPLSWIQEKEKEDSQFFVILDKPAAKGEQLSITTTYAGKDAVRNEGGGNYYPVVRDRWYPNTHLGDYANYQITFRIPRNLTMVATGTLVSQKNEGNQNVSEWKTEAPIGVAGFNFGDFITENVKLEKEGVTVAGYVNRQVPDVFNQILNAAESSKLDGPSMAGGWHVSGYTLGSLSTTPMLKKSVAEAALSVELYTNFFGPVPYKSLNITQQTAFGYGQAWPGLVFLPITYFLDTTQRHQFGMDLLKGQYWKVVEPHEVAHEWWGHSIGWSGYRDQWMSEGFADFSASLFIQYIRKDRGAYQQFWKDQREMLLEKDNFGHRPNDVGAVTMGYRVNTSKVGGYTGQNMLYPKGAYILHMLRQMMYSNKTGDAEFKVMMQDLVKTYRNQPVSTEDFKAMVEKHMTPGMDAAGNRKMDWFFDEWVYGTEIPSYKMDSKAETGADGKVSYTISITQSGVSPTFRMVVPLYYELADGKVGMLGQLLLVGNQTNTQKIPFSGTVPQRLMINYNDDILTAN
jgi:hypothetical protein